jgi:hypothetical protein
MSRIAAPMVGGMISSTVLTLGVIPALYALVKQWQLRRAVRTALRPDRIDPACADERRMTGSARRAPSLQPFDRRRSAFVITDAELRLMARAAIIGDSSQPVIG